MYKTDIACTYKFKTNELRDIQYQQDFLQVFSLGSYNDIDVNKKIKELYAQIKENPRMREILQKFSEKASVLWMQPKLRDDLEIGMVLLFSYDYFDLFHICLVEFFQSGAICDENFEKLMKKLD